MMWLFAVLGLLAILLMLPVYLYIYFDGEFKLAVRVFFVKFTIPLTDPDSKPKKKQKKTTVTKTKTDASSFSDKLSRLSSIITSVRERVLKAFVIKRVDISVAVGTDDPCSTAILFGTVNSILYPLVKFAETLMTIKKKVVNVTADYDNDSTEVFFSVIIKTFLLKLAVSLILLISDGTIKPNKLKEKDNGR